MEYVNFYYFELQRKSYLLLVDSYSSFTEVAQTKTKNVDAVWNKNFLNVGAYDILYADNVPYYDFTKFKHFANS